MEEFGQRNIAWQEPTIPSARASIVRPYVAFKPRFEIPRAYPNNSRPFEGPNLISVEHELTKRGQKPTTFQDFIEPRALNALREDRLADGYGKHPAADKLYEAFLRRSTMRKMPSAQIGEEMHNPMRANRIAGHHAAMVNRDKQDPASEQQQEIMDEGFNIIPDASGLVNEYEITNSFQTSGGPPPQASQEFPPTKSTARLQASMPFGQVAGPPPKDTDGGGFWHNTLVRDITGGLGALAGAALVAGTAGAAAPFVLGGGEALLTGIGLGAVADVIDVAGAGAVEEFAASGAAGAEASGATAAEEAAASQQARELEAAREEQFARNRQSLPQRGIGSQQTATRGFESIDEQFDTHMARVNQVLQGTDAAHFETQELLNETDEFLNNLQAVRTTSGGLGGASAGSDIFQLSEEGSNLLSSEFDFMDFDENLDNAPNAFQRMLGSINPGRVASAIGSGVLAGIGGTLGGAAAGALLPAEQVPSQPQLSPDEEKVISGKDTTPSAIARALQFSLARMGQNVPFALVRRFVDDAGIHINGRDTYYQAVNKATKFFSRRFTSTAQIQ